MAKEWKPYWERLRDPRWQKKRLEIMERDHFCCCDCRDGESTLNVHHLRYIKGYEPWEYDDDDLVTLCEPCHEKRHAAKSSLDEIMSRLSNELANQVLGYAFGLLAAEADIFIYKHDLEMKLDAEEFCGIGIVQAIERFRGYKIPFSALDYIAKGGVLSLSEIRRRYPRSEHDHTERMLLAEV